MCQWLYEVFHRDFMILVSSLLSSQLGLRVNSLGEQAGQRHLTLPTGKCSGAEHSLLMGLGEARAT